MRSIWFEQWVDSIEGMKENILQGVSQSICKAPGKVCGRIWHRFLVSRFGVIEVKENPFFSIRWNAYNNKTSASLSVSKSWQSSQTKSRIHSWCLATEWPGIWWEMLSNWDGPARRRPIGGLGDTGCQTLVVDKYQSSRTSNTSQCVVARTSSTRAERHSAPDTANWTGQSWRKDCRIFWFHSLFLWKWFGFAKRIQNQTRERMYPVWAVRLAVWWRTMSSKVDSTCPRSTLQSVHLPRLGSWPAQLWSWWRAGPRHPDESSEHSIQSLPGSIWDRRSRTS